MEKKEKNQLIQTPKGMHDILPDDYAYFNLFYEKAEEIASYYGFQPIETPILEKAELFSRTLGETTDVVEKEMYTLRTKGGDQLALRPEGTAGVMRAYIEHGMHTLPQPVLLSYRGPFFRHENPQHGRYRSFHQFGLEILGEEKSIGDAMTIQIFHTILEELKVGPAIVRINSLGDKECRPNYRRELVGYYKKYFHALCKDCKNRFKENPLRLLDCKDAKCVELKKEAPQMIQHLCHKCKDSFREVLEFLEASKIPYVIDNQLVRGLDYYTRTVFEFFLDRPDEISSIALGGGGRYDELGKTIGKREVPAVGATLGVDRVVQALKAQKISTKPKKISKIFLIQLGVAAKYKSLSLLEMFRKAHIPIYQSLSKDSLKSQLIIALKLNMAYALILGQKEAIDSTIIVQNIETREQETVSINSILDYIKLHLGESSKSQSKSVK